MVDRNVSPEAQKGYQIFQVHFTHKIMHGYAYGLGRTNCLMHSDANDGMHQPLVIGIVV